MNIDWGVILVIFLITMFVGEPDLHDKLLQMVFDNCNE